MENKCRHQPSLDYPQIIYRLSLADVITPINNRICRRCDHNAVDDEEYFSIYCSYFNEERYVLFDEANNYIEDFQIISSNLKVVMLLNCHEQSKIKLFANMFACVSIK